MILMIKCRVSFETQVCLCDHKEGYQNLKKAFLGTKLSDTFVDPENYVCQSNL